jgi:GDSL-like Lipase/Acylhydrolase family/Protein of unknown function (DUF3772)
VLVLGCFVVTLGIAELVLRLLDHPELRITPPHAAYAYDAETGWSMLPNSFTHTASGNRTISVQTNSLGLREQELDQPRPGTFLFIGDSFTFGYDAEVDERFSNLLQRELPHHLMVNAGVSGYGTDQQYLTMLRLWNRVRPQVVVLTICIDNDRDDNSSSFRWFYHKPYFVRAIEGEWEIRGYPVPLSKGQLYARSVWTERSLLARFAVYAYWRIRHAETIVPDPTEHLINMVRWAAQARGAQLVVGLQRHEARLEAHLQAQKIPYATFDEAKAYPIAGWHWTPEGNALVAKRYLALFAEVGLTSSLPQQSSELADVDRIDRMLDQLEGTIAGGDGPVQASFDFRDAIAPVRATVRAMIDDSESRRARIDGRLKLLGPAPAKEAPPEDAALADERARLGRELGELDKTLQRARRLAGRADLLARRHTEQRRAFYRHDLFERTPSALSSATWLAAARSFPAELRGVGEFVRKWSIAVWDSGGVSRAGTMLAALFVLGMAALMLAFQRTRHSAAAPEESTRSAKATSSFGVLLGLGLTAPLALIALAEALQVRMVEISSGLAAAIFIATLGHAAAVGVFAPDAPSRRLLTIDDAMARMLARHLVGAALALAALAMALAVHRAIAAPAPLLVATDMVYALVIAAILLHLLLWTRGDVGRELVRLFPPMPWLRLVGWCVLVAIVIALVAGYAYFAAVVAVTLVSVIVALNVLYLSLSVAKAMLRQRAGAGAPDHQIADIHLGMSAVRVGPSLGRASVSIVLGLLLAAVFLAVAPW